MTPERTTNEPTPCWPLTAAATVLAAALRLLPWKPPNFGAVGALSIYAGARLPWYAALALPMAVMYATDIIIWQMTGLKPFNSYAYAAYLFAVLLGLLVRRSA